MWLLSFGASIASLLPPLSCVSALFWYYESYGFVFSSILIHMSYIYFYINSSYRARSSEPQVVLSYLPNVSKIFTVSSYFQLNNTTYQNINAWYYKYSHYCLNFRILMLNFCNTIFHTIFLFILLHWFLFSNFANEYLIMLINKNKQNLICYCN